MSTPSPRRARKTLLAVAVSVMATALLAVTGCTTGQTPADGGSAAPGAPLENLKVATASQLGTLSVNQEAGIANYQVAALFQEGLLGLDNTGALVPALAESWSQTDNKVWKFEIRKDAKFSDGTAVTVDDILFSIKIARDPKKSPGVSVYWPTNITSVKQTGDWEITVTLDAPNNAFGADVSNAGGLFVTSQAFYEKAKSYGSATDLIVGTGPYTVTEFDPTSHVSLAKNENYWGTNDGPATVRIDFITDDATRQVAFQQGQADVALGVPLDQSEQWGTNGSTVEFYSDRSYQGLTFDPNVAPFDDIHVRNAIAMAVDKSGIVAGILKGKAEAATGIDSPEQLAPLVGLDAAKAGVAKLPAASFSIDDAKAELAKSSHADGFTTTLTYPTGYPAVGKASLAIADSLSKIGITVNVKEVTLDTWLNDLGNGKAGLEWMIYLPTTSIPNEISSWLLAASGPGANPANWTDDKLAAQVAAINSIDDKQKQFDEIMATTSVALEQSIYVPVYWGQAALATRKGVVANDFGSYTLQTNWAAVFTQSA
ncbi:MAG TPA: ABC transporter substrate-binding protein [Propionibacteriaceae bacterium]|nr:ABC transporter substrate-binding protein [Propionibacteriaceae bacterium]